MMSWILDTLGLMFSLMAILSMALISLVLIVAVLCTPFVGIYMVYRTFIASSDRALEYKEYTKTPTKHLIGYKRTKLLQMRHTEDHLLDLTFEGVVGSEFQVTGHASSPRNGFHAYRKYSKALKHPQGADHQVLLEVCGSGNIEEHRKGFETTQQRVLQVLIGGCSVECSKQATHYATYPGRKTCLLYCEDHKPNDTPTVDIRSFMTEQQETVEGEVVNVCPIISELYYGNVRIPVFQRTVAL